MKPAAIEQQAEIQNYFSANRRVLIDIFQSVFMPVIAAILFFLWLFQLAQTHPPQLLIFPLSGLLLILLYFVSGHIYSRVLLAFLTVVGFFCVTLTDTVASKSVFAVETVWLWGMFFLLEEYNRSFLVQHKRNSMEEEILDTKITLLESRITDNDHRIINLKQKISNYQALGSIVQILGTTLSDEKIIPLVAELAEKFIGKGRWKVKKGISNDVFARYVKNQQVPLIIQDLAFDTRFALVRPRFHSLIAVPLEINGKYWGILKGVAAAPRVFDEPDLRLLSVISTIASLAINNARLYDKTQELAITDGLTGLYVNRYFKERLAIEVLRAANHDLPLSVAIFDIDHFKNINDTYGHAAGDVVLRQVAALLRRRLRETDFVCRYGGEEFALIMFQTAHNEAVKVCEHLLRAVREEKFLLPVESFHPVQIKVTASAGVADLTAEISSNEMLLKRADEALYRAKKNGRDQVRS